MRSTSIRAVRTYDVTGRLVTFECEPVRESGEGTSGDRTVPVTLDFLRPDSFRFRLDVNPEGGSSVEGGSTEAGLELDDEGFRRQVDLTVSESSDSVVLETAALRVVVGLAEWSFDVVNADGGTLLSEHRSQVGAAGIEDIEPLGFRETEMNNNGLFAVRDVGTSLSLRHDEHVYGFGEKFTALDKRGQSIDSWTMKARGTETERSYKNVPFSSRRGATDCSWRRPDESSSTSARRPRRRCQST